MFVAGFATAEEIRELERRGWDVEPAEKYNLVGRGEEFLMEAPSDDEMSEDKKNSTRAVVVFVDNSLFSVMDGPDWDKSHVDK